MMVGSCPHSSPLDRPIVSQAGRRRNLGSGNPQGPLSSPAPVALLLAPLARGGPLLSRRLGRRRATPRGLRRNTCVLAGPSPCPLRLLRIGALGGSLARAARPRRGRGSRLLK